MSEVTYYVALPFVPSDDGIAPGEAIECFNPNAAVMKAVAQTRPCRRRRVQPQRGSGDRRLQRRQADPEVRRRAGRPERAVRPAKLDWVRNEITRMRGQLRASRLRCRKCAKAGRRPAATLLQLGWQPRHPRSED
jgi:hypothetical protein